MVITDPLHRPSERFLQVIQSFFSQQGYMFQKSKKSFIKPFEKGWHRLSFEFRISTLTSVNIRWYVTFEKLEKLYAELLGTPRQYKSFWTMNADMANHTRWLINPHSGPSLYNDTTLQYDDFSINQAASSIINFYETFIIPYFEKFSTYQSIEKYYNEEMAFRSIKGLIMAKYTQRSDFAGLAQIVRKQLEQWPSKTANQRLVLDRTMELLENKEIKALLD